MIPVKRIEIVVDAPQSGRVTELLTSRGLTGWTMVRGAAGAGDRGSQPNDGISRSTSNTLILTTCMPEQLESVVEELRALLSRYGGMCLVSDAMWLRH